MALQNGIQKENRFLAVHLATIHQNQLFFTEKTYPPIAGLPVSDAVKKIHSQTLTVGRLLPLILDIDKAEQLADLREIIQYKKNLK